MNTTRKEVVHHLYILVNAGHSPQNVSSTLFYRELLLWRQIATSDE